VPALYAAALGTLKAGMAFSARFCAFGPEPTRAQMEIGGAVGTSPRPGGRGVHEGSAGPIDRLS
jgi:hypothetical protein